MDNIQKRKKELIDQKQAFETLAKRKFIFIQTAELYGGVAGLFDYGPIGCGLKANIIQNWKKHFIIEEDLLEISSSVLTPSVVFKHSGHEERFIDYMVKDVITKEHFRADHLIENFIEKELQKKDISDSLKQEYMDISSRLNNFKKTEEFDEVIRKYNISNPNNPKNKLSDTYTFNLMFDTKIGPLGDLKGYLRPETAQSIFINFKRLLEFKNGKLPFGSSVIGLAFRNEIAPRNGLLRVREFEMAEIEYFIDPLDKKHPKFKNIQDIEVPLFSRELQQTNQDPQLMTFKDAVEKKNINNEMLGYFMGRTYQFALDIGLEKQLLRFRQHLSGEMAHYAQDCWDLEVLSSSGWIECVGLADRSAYDLSAHMKGSGDKLMASRIYDTPIMKNVTSFEINKGYIGKNYKTKSKEIIQSLENMEEDEKKEL